MAEVNAVKRDFCTEEVDYKSIVSERLMTKFAEAITWLNDNCYKETFNYNGNYSLLVNCPADGMRFVPFDSEICGIAVSNIEVGTSGTTTIDLLTSPGCGVAPTSVFDTKPIIDTTSVNYSGSINFFGSVISPVCVGVNAFQTTQWLATPGEGIPLTGGSFLVSNLDTAMEDGKFANLEVWIRRC